MKKLTFLLAAAACLFLCSCSNPKPDDSKNVYSISSAGNQHLEMPKDDRLGKIIGNGKYVLDSVVVMNPTWGQSVYYVKETGRGWMIIGAAACIAVLALIVGLLAFNKIEMGKGPGFLMLACLGGFLGFAFGGAASVKWNNKFEVPVAEYRKAIERTGNSQELWDSRYLSNHMSWAAVK